MSLRVPEGSGKLVMFRTALSIALELEVTVYLYTVLDNDVQPLWCFNCAKNYGVNIANQ